MAKAKKRAEMKVAYLTKKSGKRQAHVPEQEVKTPSKKAGKGHKNSKKN